MQLCWSIGRKCQQRGASKGGTGRVAINGVKRSVFAIGWRQVPGQGDIREIGQVWAVWALQRPAQEARHGVKHGAKVCVKQQAQAGGHGCEQQISARLVHGAQAQQRYGAALARLQQDAHCGLWKLRYRSGAGRQVPGGGAGGACKRRACCALEPLQGQGGGAHIAQVFFMLVRVWQRGVDDLGRQGDAQRSQRFKAYAHQVLVGPLAVPVHWLGRAVGGVSVAEVVLAHPFHGPDQAHTGVGRRAPVGARCLTGNVLHQLEPRRAFAPASAHLELL